MANSTSKPRPDAARRRKRAQQARQIVLYTLLVGLLIAVGAYAGAIITGKTASPFTRDFTTPTEEAYVPPAPPCPSSEQAKPVPPDQIKVNVYNGTATARLARTAADELAARGFGIGEVANAKTTYAHTVEIRTGVAGVDAALTLAYQISGASVVVDAREGSDVDLVLGALYTGLVPIETVDLNYEAALPSAVNCEPAMAAAPTEQAGEGDGSEPTADPAGEGEAGTDGGADAGTDAG